MTNIHENIKRITAQDTQRNFSKKSKIANKIIAAITFITCVLNIPALFGYIYSLITDFAFGELNDLTTTYLILYALFLLCMTILVVSLILSSIFMLKNDIRRCAIALNHGAWSAGIAAVSDVMIVGIKPETIALTLSIIVLIIAKIYVDPTLSYERRQNIKTNTIKEKEEYEQGTLGLSKNGKGYARFNYFNVLWIFVVFSVAGYFWEILWHMIVDEPGVYQERAGFLFGPFSPIYGLGGLIISFIVNRLQDKNPIVIFIVCAALGGMFEFAVSWFLETAFGIRSWDYSHLPFNINGRVSLRFFIMWGLIGLIYTKLAFKPLIRGINKIPWKWRYGLTILMSIIVWGNAIMTLQSLDCWYQRNSGKEMNAPIEQFYNKYFDDEFMQNRFQNMKMEVSNAARTSVETKE